MRHMYSSDHLRSPAPQRKLERVGILRLFGRLNNILVDSLYVLILSSTGRQADRAPPGGSLNRTSFTQVVPYLLTSTGHGRLVRRTKMVIERETSFSVLLHLQFCRWRVRVAILVTGIPDHGEHFTRLSNWQPDHISWQLLTCSIADVGRLTLIWDLNAVVES
ncbi:uncharacterized protein BT62DRAFT_459993 [Guyanagaster necrorhizus]|uniref:Uncharacterized protein n=1 Tax=Guyanagaster necrorhizus TaxID=856835 RepID=A0A9P7VIW8_9AGAR|nr:uncharacterized protein BT62DRAFT_459993 [Guyanagaster necrorhizus MCA 3950]KAG7441928.1 hypothetical protein BT62DRAFT_459993 [Guyanagaster necrorhizus MCA 3950]